MKVSQGELAKIMGVSKRTIRNYQEHGMPREGGRNSRKYDTRDCIEWWAANKMDRPSASEDGDLPSVEESDRRWRRARARLKELEYRERREELIRFEEARELVLEAAERIRQRLLNLPGRRLKEIASATDLSQVKRLRDDAVCEILEELEQMFTTAAEEEMT